MGPNGGRSKDFPSVDAAREANSKLPPDQVTADLNAVADWAKKLPSTNGTLAVAGFCWGGGQAFRFPTTRKDLKAAYVFYGPPPTDVASVSAPVYGFYGELDNRITSTVDDTRNKMKGKAYDPIVYPGAGHGFMRTGEDPGCSSDHCKGDRAAHDAAWERWLKLLKGL
jgi:carboxymethylenebutenolidase